MSDLPGLALAGAALLTILALAEVLRARWHVRPEATRKLVHVLSGMVAAAFPWLLSSAWSVAFLGVSYAALMLVTQRRGWLTSVHGVARDTLGGLCYPVAVAATFALARHRPAIYVASILVLAFGDAAAALVGTRFGRRLYDMGGGVRSVEGSTAFVVTAATCVHVALVVSGVPPAVAAPAALTIAVAGALLEAVAPRGTDNLVLPLAAMASLLTRTVLR